MSFDDDSMMGRFIQRWSFMLNVAIWISISFYGLWAVYQFPFYVFRWYNATDPKESKYLGWRVIARLFGCYTWFLFFSDWVFNFIDTSWPTLFSLVMDKGGPLESLHGLSIWGDCLLFGLTAWGISNYTEKLGFLEKDEQTGEVVFYPHVYQ